MKALFWNVDTEIDFMERTGALYVPGAEAIRGNLRRTTDYARQNGIYIVNTADVHDEDSLEISGTPDFITRFPAHCMRGKKGSEFIPETQPRNPVVIDWKDRDIDIDAIKRTKELVLYKDAFDIFIGSPHTDKVLDILQPEQAIVYGVAGNVCVNYAIIGLQKKGISVYAIRDAIRSLPSICSDEEQFEKWKQQGVEIVAMKDLETTVEDLLRR